MRVAVQFVQLVDGLPDLHFYLLASQLELPCCLSGWVLFLQRGLPELPIYLLGLFLRKPADSVHELREWQFDLRVPVRGYLS